MIFGKIKRMDGNYAESTIMEYALETLDDSKDYLLKLSDRRTDEVHTMVIYSNDKITFCGDILMIKQDYGVVILDLTRFYKFDICTFIGDII